MKKAVIFERKYPKLDYDSIMNEYLGTDHSDYDPSPGFSEYIENIEKTTTLVLIPHRKTASQNFIEAAISISEDFEIDTVISTYDSYISVELSFDCCGNMAFLKPLFCAADDYSFFANINSHDITISLDFYTHAVIRNHKIVAPPSLILPDM